MASILASMHQDGRESRYLPRQRKVEVESFGSSNLWIFEEGVVGLRSTSIRCCADLLTIRSDGRIINQSIASLAAAEHGWHRTQALLREK